MKRMTLAAVGLLAGGMLAWVMFVVPMSQAINDVPLKHATPTTTVKPLTPEQAADQQLLEEVHASYAWAVHCGGWVQVEPLYDGLAHEDGSIGLHDVVTVGCDQ